jgi:putative ABC transport system permease protein
MWLAPVLPPHHWPAFEHCFATHPQTMAMFRNHVRFGFRNLRRQRGYSVINIAGLTLGLACCLIIAQYVAFEYSFDRFHENEDHLYRLVRSMARGEEDLGAGATFTPQAMGPALVQTIPEIARYTRLHPQNGAALLSNPQQPQRVFEEEAVFFADRDFLEMFSFPLIAGDRRESLTPGSVLISENLQRKLFGASNGLGETLHIVGNVEGSYRVTGILAEIPANSHIQFEMLLPMTDLLQTEQYVNEPESGWSYNNFITYLQLHPGAHRAEVDRKMTEIQTAQIGEMMEGFGYRPDMRLYTQPLHDVYLNSDIESFATRAGSYRTVYFFSLIGLITLLIALVNYVNLATARALDRAREVGVRKAVGAQRGQLISQFVAESAVTITTSAVMAVALAIVFTPLIERVADVQLTLQLWRSPAFVAAVLITLACCTLLAGFYPAVMLSAFRPAAVLKGETTSSKGPLWLRRGLVVFQFAAAVVLIGGTVIVYSQLTFMREMDLGLDLEQVVTVPGPKVVSEETSYTTARLTFVEELRRLPGIRGVATSWSLPGHGFNWHGAMTWRAELDQSNSIRGVVTYIDTSFAALYGIDVIAGAGFSASHALWGSSTTPYPILANQSAVRSLGFSSPAEAIGHPLLINGTEVNIIGVVRDFNWSSAREERENIFLGRASGAGHISIRVAANHLPATLAAIERTYTEMFPGNVFRYGFIEESFGAQYHQEGRFATIFSLFAGLAIAIACLGLFGLATFTSQQRSKEVGVRKVLGASVASLVALLARDFLKLVAIAVLVGSPVAYVMMQRWLESFAYRIEVGPSVFAFVAVLALGVAFLTVSRQAILAAMADPVRAIRSE